MTVIVLLALCALVTTIGSAVRNWPLWVPVLLIVVAMLIGALPLR